MTMRICVITGSRAEFHLLAPIIRKMEGDPFFDLRIAVTGSHLSKRIGYTVDEIEAEGFSIDVKIPILGDGDGASDIDAAEAAALVGFGAYFDESSPDAIMVLGDRYELLPVAMAALTRAIPLIHIHGGEVTEGAIDEAVRHSLTKLSALHFVACEPYRRRVIQLGEDPQRVFDVGALGVENARTVPLLSKQELFDDLDIPLDAMLGIVTFHPETLSALTPEAQVEALLAALEAFPDMFFLFTKSNADAGGNAINDAIDAFVDAHENCKAVFSLGAQRYLSALSHARVVIGNSSSGILETPAFGVPTVNVGDRQKGRIRAQNVLDCDTDARAIEKAIRMALDDGFALQALSAENPYGEGDASTKITETIRDIFSSRGVERAKQFFDIEFSLDDDGQMRQ